MTSLSAWLVSGSSVKLIGLYGSDAGDVQFVEAFVCELSLQFDFEGTSIIL